MEGLSNQVLVRLPVKSLLRFRCVCKSWYAFIDSPNVISSINSRKRNFILSWPKYSNLTLFRAIHITHGFPKDFSLNCNPMPSVFSSLSAQHCKGLVLLKLSDYNLFVLNPSTRHCKELPAIPDDLHQVSRRKCYFGLGYDHTNDDYKVISLTQSYEVWIFGLMSNCWRRILGFPYRGYNYIEVARDGNSCLDGCVYFLCSENEWRSSYIIAAFDVAKETFSVVPLPTYDEGQVHITCLQVFEGCLSIKFLTAEKVDLYVRKKDGVEFTWTKLFSLTTPESSLFGDGIQFNMEFRILGCSRNGHKILLIFLGRMYSYDLKETSLEMIETSLTSNCLHNFIYCVESFVFVDNDSSIEDESVVSIGSLFIENE